MFFKITRDFINEIIFYFRNNLMLLVNVIYLALPYVMYYFGLKEKINLVIVLIIPLFVIAFIYYLKAYANKIGKGKMPPIPVKRFTDVDEDGEVSVETDRIQELILYTADLEDWIERKGLK